MTNTAQTAHSDSDVPVLEIKDLCIGYTTRAGEIPAVVDFSLTVRAGESVGLVGESGCGKSTVAMAIMQYMGRNGAVTGGSIKYRGREMTTMGEAELTSLRGDDIAMVYQEPFAALNPSVTCGRQLMEVPMVHDGADEAAAYQIARQMLADVKLPDPDRVMKSYPHQISGGQQQRVVIAMALLSKPSLLLCDEPTTALDVTVEAGIVALLAEIKETFGTAVLFISHNLGLVREVCDRVCVMYSGEQVEVGSIGDVFNRMHHPYTRGLFGAIPVPTADKHSRPLVSIAGQLPLPNERPDGCNFGPRCDHFVPGQCDKGATIGMGTAHTDPGGIPNHLVRCTRWPELAQTAPTPANTREASPDSAEIVVNVEGMRKYYEIADRSLAAVLGNGNTRYVKANEDLSFMARRGQIVAIVGESGCGKSTFAKVMLGLETATAGKLEIEGDELGAIDVRSRSTEQIAGTQMIFQNPSETLNPSMTVGQQIERVIRKFGVSSDTKDIGDRVNALLDTVKLPRAFARRLPRQLSGGQKQRVGIARAFAGNPRLVVADEPVSALDVSVQAAVTELLMEIQHEFDTTMLFISHDLSLVRYLADRIVVMYLGRIMEQGTVEEVFAPPYNPYTEALLSAVPIADTRLQKRKIVLEGSLPSPLNPPKGCPFSTRCPRKLAGSICDDTPPPLRETESGHRILCHLSLEELNEVPPVFTMTAGVDAAA